MSTNGLDLAGEVAPAPIAQVISSEQNRLKNFIRKRVADEADVEDVLQDVFYELVKAYDAFTPLRQTTAWLYRVARNRIIDLFRRRSTDRSRLEWPGRDEDGGSLAIEAWLPSPEAGPEQREVFIAHELEGRSFKELADASGLSVNTLLSRKHYAVLHLRKRLQSIYKEFADV